MPDRRVQDKGPPRIERCTVSENGECAAHGQILERRDEHSKRLNNHAERLKLIENQQSNWKGSIRTIAFVALFLVGGAYLYPYLHIQDSDIEHRLLKAEIEKEKDKHRADVSVLEKEIQDIKLAQNEFRYQQIDVKDELNRMNNLYERLIVILAPAGRTQKVFVENFDDQQDDRKRD